MSLDRPPVLERGSHSNVLYLVPSMHELGREGCAALCAAEDGAGVNLLAVLSVQSPDDRLDEWHTHVNPRSPREANFVVLGGQTRSASAAEAETGTTDGTSVSVQTVSDPGNLTRIGIAISSPLMEWAEAERPIVCCFRSATTILQYASVKRVYRFFHELTGHVRAADAVAHYHLDPTAHDQQDVNTLKTLFDAVVEADEDGWTVAGR